MCVVIVLVFGLVLLIVFVLLLVSLFFVLLYVAGLVRVPCDCSGFVGAVLARGLVLVWCACSLFVGLVLVRCSLCVSFVIVIVGCSCTCS